jgi:hypothetical protein
MHLFFLGMGKTMALDIREWTLCRNLNKSFIKYATGLLETIEELQLPWLKLLPYSNRKFGGWVAENYVALVRLFKWFYQPLPSLAEEEPWEQPETPIEAWLVKDLWNWLKLRGYSTRGLKAELFERVEEIMNSSDVAPEIVAPSGGTVEQLLNTINRLYDLISLMMKPSINEDEIKKAEVYVRLFLTEYSRLDEHLYSNKEKVTWHSKYNFLSLLRCVEQMRDTGSSRNLWEGGLCGEGFLRFVKATIKSGLRYMWQYGLMSNLIRQRTLFWLTNEYAKTKQQQLLQYRVYKSMTHVESAWLSRKPLSFAITADNKYYIACIAGADVVGKEIEIKKFHETHNEMCYFTFKLNPETITIGRNSELRGGVLLPLLDSDGKPKKQCNVYTAIDNNWNYLGDSMGNMVGSNPNMINF